MTVTKTIEKNFLHVKFIKRGKFVFSSCMIVGKIFVLGGIIVPVLIENITSALLLKPES